MSRAGPRTSSLVSQPLWHEVSLHRRGLTAAISRPSRLIMLDREGETADSNLICRELLYNELSISQGIGASVPDGACGHAHRLRRASCHHSSTALANTALAGRGRFGANGPDAECWSLAKRVIQCSCPHYQKVGPMGSARDAMKRPDLAPAGGSSDKILRLAAVTRAFRHEPGRRVKQLEGSHSMHGNS